MPMTVEMPSRYERSALLYTLIAFFRDYHKLLSDLPRHRSRRKRNRAMLRNIRDKKMPGTGENANTMYSHQSRTCFITGYRGTDRLGPSVNVDVVDTQQVSRLKRPDDRHFRSDESIRRLFTGSSPRRSVALDRAKNQILQAEREYLSAWHSSRCSDVALKFMSNRM